jgi:hypothetical protein
MTPFDHLATRLEQILKDADLQLAGRGEGSEVVPLNDDQRRDALRGIVSELTSWTLVRDLEEWVEFRAELAASGRELEPDELPPVNTPFLMQQTEHGIAPTKVNVVFVGLTPHDAGTAIDELWEDAGEADSRGASTAGVIAAEYGVWVRYQKPDAT